MIVVIQCAARKAHDAGYLKTPDGRRVLFVAQPESAPSRDGILYARPDDLADAKHTWRDELLASNHQSDDNPFGLKPAFKLYQNKAYEKLAAKISIDKLFILSAGWGLISGTFLTPYYDITFSAQADDYKKRGRRDRYDDFSMIPNDQEEPILFFGGKDYLPLFDRLTSNARGPRVVFFNSIKKPLIEKAEVVKFQTRTKTNWHYECVAAFLSGSLDSEISMRVGSNRVA